MKTSTQMAIVSLLHALNAGSHLGLALVNSDRPSISILLGVDAIVFFVLFWNLSWRASDQRTLENIWMRERGGSR